MCNAGKYGSLEFNPTMNEQEIKIKVYQTLCHQILFVIQKQTLDDTPTTIHTIRTKMEQLQELLGR